jgi:hypothetical protein
MPPKKRYPDPIGLYWLNMLTIAKAAAKIPYWTLPSGRASKTT